MRSAHFFKAEAIDGPRIAPERESPRLMEPLGTMCNQQGWGQSHGPPGRGMRGLGWGGTRRRAAMLIGEKTTAPQILEGWGWRGAGRWRSGEEEPCTCSPPTLLLLLPSPPLVPSPELFNSPFLPSSLLLHLPSLGVSAIYCVDRSTMLKSDLALFCVCLCGLSVRMHMCARVENRGCCTVTSSIALHFFF